MAAKDLTIRVREIKGSCPVYSCNDQFEVEAGFKLVATKALCLHSLASIMPYYTALSRGVRADALGLTKAGTTAYVQCLDPCAFTGGGTVIFEITPFNDKNAELVKD